MKILLLLNEYIFYSLDYFFIFITFFLIKLNIIEKLFDLKKIK